MKKNVCLGVLAVNVVILMVLLIPNCAFAVFNVSLRPFEGGNDLRFGKVGNVGPYTSKEIIVSIDSDIGTQYQFVQTLLEPLTNEQGISLPRNQFTVYAIRGSNKLGTVSVEQEESVSPGRRIIYTSNQSGASDSFNLVYVLKSPFDVPSGSYRGRIAFVLEPIGSAEQQVTVILNVFAEIDVESNIEIKTITGSRAISLSSAQPDTRASDVLVDIKGGMGSQFKILQLLTQPLESLEGGSVPYEAINFKISEAKMGSGPERETSLSSRQDSVYVSGTRGDADSFVITYSLGEPEKQKAGRYKSNIRYTFEGAAAQGLLGNFSLEVEIARIFDLIITPELGGTIQFRDLKYQEAPKQSEVLIEINSNIGRQYQVSQQSLTGLVNKEGKTIPTKYFTLQEESLETKGTLPFSSPTEVKTGDMVLFLSDKSGSSDRFKVIYTLKPSLEILTGDYSTRITYSISEI
jgi:hypothetical protein